MTDMRVEEFESKAASGRMLRVEEMLSTQHGHTHASFIAKHGHIYIMLRKSPTSAYAWVCRSLASGAEVELWPMDTEEITDE